MRAIVDFTLGRVAAFLLSLFLPVAAAIAQDSKTKPNRAPAYRKPIPAESELSRSRSDVLQKIKETRAGAEKLLALHEAERQRAEERYEQRKDLYYKGLIARNDVLEAENALVQAMARIDEDKRWLAETDMAITEVSMRDEILRLPGLAVGGYSETATLLRYNGGALWTLSFAPKIEKFFLETFHRPLPISAFGQTATHDRLRFDHRNAMDVALHPDSPEGRSLLNYLRQAGIPFIAFRSAVPGAATGAHIHIGKPSPRT
jgi:Spy/CpxP family protein refolding chaperone